MSRRVITSLLTLFACIVMLRAQTADSVDVASVYDGKAWRTIDRSGAYIQEQSGSPMDDCWGDPLLRAERDGKVGFFDRDGREVIAPRFDNATCFINDIASVKLGELWGGDRSFGADHHRADVPVRRPVLALHRGPSCARSSQWHR